MRHLDLFSGIGGFALAAQMVWGDDYENIAFCDNNEFCQEVLAKNFPGCTIIGDIRELTWERLAANASSDGCDSRRSLERGRQDEGSQDGTRSPDKQKREGRLGITREALAIDILTGGFPCQPFSCAGKRGGASDDRYLWPEMLRVVSEFKPRWVIGENVAGFVEMALRQVQADLEGEGYEVGNFVIPACAVNAPHRRDRYWIVAHLKGKHDDRRGSTRGRRRELADGDSDSDAADTTGERLRGGREDGREQPTGLRGENLQPDWQRDWREVAFATCVHRVDDGLPRRLVRLPSGRTISQSRWRTEALKAYGNAIVPQVAMEIMKAIKAIDNEGEMLPLEAL